MRTAQALTLTARLGLADLMRERAAFGCQALALAAVLAPLLLLFGLKYGVEMTDQQNLRRSARMGCHQVPGPVPRRAIDPLGSILLKKNSLWEPFALRLDQGPVESGVRPRGEAP